jgi:hypothetical protein
MKVNQKVQIQKIGPVDNPEYVTPDAKGYRYGRYNGNISIPSDYSVEGTLMQDISVGEPINLARTKRNNVECRGWFITTRVTRIEQKDGEDFVIAHTRNSIYKIKSDF